MAKLILETDALDTAKSEIETLKSTLDSIKSTIEGFPTDSSLVNVSEMNATLTASFDAGKKALAEIVTKGKAGVEQTITALTDVVTKHTEAQNSFPKIEIPGSSDTTAESAEDSGDDQNTSDDADYSGGDDYDGGGGGGGGGGSDSSLLGGALAGMLPQAGQEYQTVNAKPTELTHAIVDVNKLSDESKKFFSREDFKYDETTGYAKVGQRYVITCDPVFGNVGDCIDFMGANGVIVQCVIGALRNDESAEKRKISFVVKEDVWTEEKQEAFTKDLLEKTTEIRNYGNIDQQGTQISSAAAGFNSAAGNRGSSSAHQANGNISSLLASLKRT